MKLQDRGGDSRRAIIASLLEQPSQTEDEMIEGTRLSKSTVRNALQLLLKARLASSQRRKRTDGKRGPGPIEYWLTTQLRDPAAIELELRVAAAGLEGKTEPEIHRVGRKTVMVQAQPRAPLFVLVKAGTNDAVLTKDGRMLRVEEHALKDVREQYERVLRGTRLESLLLEEYYARFYPELKDRKDRPVF